jgi:GST-like protein
MIDLYYWPTPNGHKITDLPYRLVPINILQGDQFSEEFLKISPNNRMPAIVDHKPSEGTEPVALFESGAILLYLAEKTGKFLSRDLHNRYEVLQWLFWQVGGLGPMAGQNHHFSSHAKELTYAVERYVRETARLYGVLNKQLTENEYIAGDYSIADMASYPWIVLHEKQSQNLNDFPYLKRWYLLMQARQGVQRAYKAGENINVPGELTEEAKKVLFQHKS